MKYSRILFFCVLTMLLAFSSCKKDEISEVGDNIEDPTVEVVTTNPLVPQVQFSVTNTGGLDLGCFSIDFPFDLLADGATYTITSYEDFEDVLMDEPLIIDFAYPINITYNEDQSTATVVDAEALGQAFANCIPEGGWGENLFPAFLISDESSCYDMVYPVNLVDVDGNVSVANDEDEFVDLLSAGTILAFEFPLSLIDEDGETVTANDDEELFALLFSCEGGGDPWGGDPIGDCWDYVFPIEMLDQDGNTVVINNHDELCNAALNGLILEHVFPVTLVNGAGEELIVNNQTELEEAWFDCINIGGGALDVLSFIFNSDFTSGLDCYSINYPLEYTDMDTGNVETIEDAAAAQAYIDASQNNIYGGVLNFPVTVTELATGDEVSFDDLQAYFEFVFTCG